MKLLLISLLLFIISCTQEVAVTSTGGGVVQPEPVEEVIEEEVVEPEV